MTTFNTVHAETMGDVIFQKKGILLHGTEGKGLIQGTKEVWDKIEWVIDKIIDGINWFSNMPYSVPKLTVSLFTEIYHLLSKITLTTPLYIFNNPYLKNTSLTFALISISIVTILTVFESLMQMIQQKHTPFKDIVKRWAIVSSGTGFIPFAFEGAFTFINKLSAGIMNIGKSAVIDSKFLTTQTDLGFFDFIIIGLFDLTAIALLIPVLLQNGRRFWDLLVLCTISPLALTSWIFDRHRHYFYAWWRSVKSLSIIQLVYAVFLLLMGTFLFGTRFIEGSFIGLLTKVLITCGALHSMAHPPRFVTALADGNGDDVRDMYRGYKNTFSTVKNTLTFNKFKLAKNLIEKLKSKNTP
jgi:hypothetical protein